VSSNPVSWITSLLAVYSVLTQSAYCKHHSTETALLYIHDHVVSAVGSQKISCPYLLDLSAAFDTIDHESMTSWSPVSHPGLVSMALFSAGSSHMCHLIASVSYVKPTCPPGTHSPAVSPKALSLVHYSSSCTPLLSVPHFLLFSKPSPLCRWQ